MPKQPHRQRPDLAPARRPAHRAADGALRSPPRNVALPVLPSAPPRKKAAARTALADAPTVAFVSLGCAKNLVDSERMLGELAESGCVISGDESAADTVVVNTCGFLDAARQEALGILRDLAARKRRGQLRRIVVAGCLVQRDGEKLRDEIPEIDALVGVNNREDIVRAVWRMDRDAALDLYLGDYHPGVAQSWNDRTRLRLTPRHYAYVRISEGCDQKCTFCTIPSIRGPMHSKSPEALLAEGRELLADGARELILIGQDTTSYGGDSGHEGGLASLLRTVNDGWRDARWIRLMYVYPSVFADAMIAAIAECDRVVKYIDIPLQHINDRVLKAMGRRVTRARTETLLARLRRRIPGVTIRTTFIVGFPGETDAQFAELCTFVRSFGFDAVGAFKYSFELGTPAARMKGQVPDDVKRERYSQLMLIQQEVALAAAQRRIGQSFDVVVDDLGHRRAAPAVPELGQSFISNTPLAPAKRVAVARHAGQAPEVDSVCLLPAGRHRPGHSLTVRCTGTAGYDLLVRER
jgi:ribosomal protein S12 methylthiotransferase